LSPIPFKGEPLAHAGDSSAAGPAPSDDVRGDLPAEALMRPLFHADRRPHLQAPVAAEPLPVEETVAEAPDAVAQEEQAPTRPEILLSGVSAVGKRKHALLGMSGGSAPLWYSEGQAIEGWSIETITDDTVTVVSQGDRFTIELYPQTTISAGGP
jgi:hypothetical protein